MNPIRTTMIAPVKSFLEGKKNFGFLLGIRFTSNFTELPKNQKNTLINKLFDATFTFSSTWRSLTTKPNPIGELVWINPEKNEIEAKVIKVMDESMKAGKHFGIIGFHCSSNSQKQMELQAKTNKQGALVKRFNQFGEGLFVGPPQVAAHFAGYKDSLVFRIATESKTKTNDTDGTFTTYIVPEKDKEIYVTAIYKINPELDKFESPAILEVFKRAFQNALKDFSEKN